MGAMEIILIVIGAIIFLLGYLMPARKKDLDEEVQLISEDEIRKLVAGEADHVKDKVADIVDETVSYSIEKTERAMERVANEKIMAVHEYSDTVLEEINKNHKEVVFLYDMLNDKHDNLMSTINEAATAADEIKQTVKDTEIAADEVSGKIDTVRQEANEAVEMIKSAEQAALEAQKEARDAMQSVIDAVENTKNVLAAFQKARIQQEEAKARARVQAQEQTVIEEQPNSSLDKEETAVPEPDGIETDAGLRDSFVESQDETPEEISNAVMEESVETAEEKVDFTPIAPKKVEIIHEPDGDYVAENEEELSTSAEFASMGLFAPKTEETSAPRKKGRTRKFSSKENTQESVPSVDLQFKQGRDNGGNSNERILELHKAGKSNMAIAKELGLGLGEVKLVIDLFEGL